MAHELTERENGLVEMAYVGNKPWHGLGQELTIGADIDTWVQQAGMDWLIKRSRVRFGQGEGQKIWDDHHVLFRGDTKEPLGMVGAKYKIVQPKECLEFFRDLVGENGFELETAGTLFGGKRFWALANIGESACILGKDEVKGYLLLTSSCDGTLATTAKFIATRVVCNNTMSMALSEKGIKPITVSHRTDFDHGVMRDKLGVVTKEFEAYVIASRALANRYLSVGQSEQLTEALLVSSGMVTKKDVTASKGYAAIMQLFQEGKGNRGESAWDWVNGVTEYVDHVQRAKSDSHRIVNAWYGKGDTLKTMAMAQALELVS